MKKNWMVIALMSWACAHAQPDVAASAPPAAASAPEAASAGDQAPSDKENEAIVRSAGSYCLIPGRPIGVKYTVIRKLKQGKQTYGSVKDVLPGLVQQAQKLNADAVIDYNGSQRFGLLPWRLVRPVVTGTAIKWEGAGPECATVGGSTLAAVLETSRPPGQTDRPQQ